LFSVCFVYDYIIHVFDCFSITFYTFLITFYIFLIALILFVLYNVIIKTKEGVSMVSDKIKGLLSMRGKKYKELASLFGISEQAMRNKFVRGSFSADELIMIADFAGCQLAFEMDDSQKILLTTADLRNPSSTVKE